MADRKTGQDDAGNRDVMVLGIGNILWADEGFGVRTVEYLASRYDFPPPAVLMDGGTQGLYLMPLLENLEGLIIVDAVDFGLPPSAIHEVHGADVPAVIGARKMSLHQTGFQEVLALLDLRGCLPRRVSLIGVQPVTMADYGGGLTGAVAARVPEVAARVLELLADDYGVHPVPFSGPHPGIRPGTRPGTRPGILREMLPGAGLMTPAVARAAYEEGRPSEEEACRFGDERVLARMER